MSEFKFDLGTKVKDTLTGFKGVISYRAQYLTGCNQYGVQPEDLDEKGEPREARQIDENRLEVIKGSKPYVLPVPKKEVIKEPGGPQSPIKHRSSPARRA
jgi:hypothetical protein